MEDTGIRRLRNHTYVAFKNSDDKIIALYADKLFSPLHTWYYSPFIYNDKEFRYAEIAIQYSKAVLFNDMSTAKQMRHCEDSKKLANLAAKINDFDEEISNQNSEEIVYDIMKRKFKKRIRWLLRTNDTYLAILEKYADSALSNDWYINIEMDNITLNNFTNLEKYGKNLLGKTIMRIRDEFRTKYQPIEELHLNTFDPLINTLKECQL